MSIPPLPRWLGRVGARCVPAWCAVALILAIGSGCQAPAYVLDAVLPQADIPAVHRPEDRVTTVFVEDRDNALPQPPLRTAIAASVAHYLQRERVVTEFTNPGDLERLRLNEENFRNWSIARIGRELEAEQVLYVTVERFHVADPEQTRGPNAHVRAKLIDVESGERIFPERDSQGHQVRTEMRFQHRQPDSYGHSALLAQHLAQRVGEDVAKLFYSHKPRAVGSGFD